MEWNVICLYLTNALYASNFAGYSLRGLVGVLTGMAIGLLLFLALVLLLVPAYGQLYPKNVPFLTAYRPYAGNWRFTWHIVANEQREKLRKLKALEGVFVSENAQFL